MVDEFLHLLEDVRDLINGREYETSFMFNWLEILKTVVDEFENFHIDYSYIKNCRKKVWSTQNQEV